MNRRRIAARAIASLFCIGVCIAHAPAYAQAARAPLSAQIGLPGEKTVDPVAALGRRWAELRDFLLAFEIIGTPPMKRRDYTAFMQNRRLGVELTFHRADSLDVPNPGLAPDAVVLSNIRLYGPGSKTHAAFTGELPFGLRFGDTREALLAKFGAPNNEAINLASMYSMRWDTKRYALFAILDKKDGGLALFSLQGPVVRSERAGFEER